MSDREIRLSDKYSAISFWEKDQEQQFSGKEWLLDMKFDGEEEIFCIFISQGRYRELFEYASLNTKRITDFHHLYHSITKILNAIILLHGFKNPNFFEMLKNCDDIPGKILYAYEKEIAKLNVLIEEYTVPIEENQIVINESSVSELITKINTLLKEPRPKYITDLIDQGYLMPNGRTVTVGLERIAEYLYTHIENVTPEILLQFRQKNGLPFTQRTAQAAATSCKPQ
jgi:hypothetical protein